jgi:hypothetical protein
MEEGVEGLEEGAIGDEWEGRGEDGVALLAREVVARAEALLPADWDAQAVANLLAGYPPSHLI